MNWEQRVNATIVLGGLLFAGWCIGRAQGLPARSPRPQLPMTGLPAANEFVPMDIGHAYFGACGFIGVEDDPGRGHAETKIWVRWGRRGDKQAAEFSPVMSHRDDILTAIDDCMRWYGDVRKELAKGMIQHADPERRRDLGVPAGRLQ